MTERIVIYEGAGVRIECDGVNHYSVFPVNGTEEILSPCLEPEVYKQKTGQSPVFGQALTGRHGT